MKHNFIIIKCVNTRNHVTTYRWKSGKHDSEVDGATINQTIIMWFVKFHVLFSSAFYLLAKINTKVFMFNVI